MAQNDNTYAKLSFNVGPGGQVLIPAEIDYGRDFGPTDRELWGSEYAANVKVVEWFNERKATTASLTSQDLSDYALPYDFLDDFESMEPEERQLVLDELAGCPELWDEQEVMIL